MSHCAPYFFLFFGCSLWCFREKTHPNGDKKSHQKTGKHFVEVDFLKQNEPKHSGNKARQHSGCHAGASGALPEEGAQDHGTKCGRQPRPGEKSKPEDDSHLPQSQYQRAGPDHQGDEFPAEGKTLFRELRVEDLLHDIPHYGGRGKQEQGCRLST